MPSPAKNNILLSVLAIAVKPNPAIIPMVLIIVVVNPTDLR